MREMGEATLEDCNILNKEISKKIIRDIRKFNTDVLKNIIKQNKNLKISRKQMSRGMKNL